MLKQTEEITNTFTVIQDTWDEEDDVELLDFVSNNKITTKYLSDSEILNIRLSDINVLFCDTHIIQKMINPKYIPNCYPDIFNSLYNRNIQKIQFKDLYDIKGNHLIITGSCLNTYEVEYFDYINYGHWAYGCSRY